MRSSLRRKQIRKQRVRSSIRKNSDRLRLSVFKSGRHIYAQIIDDTKGETLVHASTLDKDLRKPKKALSNIDSAIQVGKILGKRAKEAGLEEVVFDKGSYRYHGVIKNLADSAREFLKF